MCSRRRVWDRVINLPFALMKEAWPTRPKPVQICGHGSARGGDRHPDDRPVRIKNLTEIRLGLNLNKPGGPQIAVLASLSQLRRQKPDQIGIPAGGPHHAADR